VAHIDVNGRSETTGFWCLVPSVSLATVGWAAELLDAFYTTPASHLVALMHSGAVLTACSVTVYGADFGPVRREYDGARGPWTGGQAVNVSLGWHWYGTRHGRGTTSVNRLCGVPDEFIDSNWRVSAIGYPNLIDKQASFFVDFNALPGPALGSTVVLGCVHGVSPHSPGPPSFDPFVGGTASPRVLTIRRRLPRSGGISP
jgi:hypothetical protein